MDHRRNPNANRRRKKSGFWPVFLIPFLLITLIVTVAVAACSDLIRYDPNQTGEAPKTETRAELPEPPEPPVAEPHAWTSATVGVTGDILIHTPIIRAYAQGDGSYDFTEIYKDVKPYFEAYDCMIANLEVPLGGSAAGEYTGYPTFNCPDSMIDALTGAGVDLLLTANNHSNDKGHNALIRTQNVLNEKGVPYIGTRLENTDSYVKIMEYNEVKIGMSCFTYSYGGTLNGLPLYNGDTERVHTFEYEKLNAFYDAVQADLDEMKAGGADFTMFFIHWGNEYQFVPNSYQKQMAKKLCEMGVDVIVGGHPHVVQPYETLTSESGHQTLCLYSTGNAISNQRRELMDSEPTGHTEDGIIFGVTFEKWSDGTVRIGGIDVLPTWVERKTSGRTSYRIIPLDYRDSDWSRYGADLSRMKKSYANTLKLVGDGVNAYRESIGLEKLPLTVE